MTTKEYMDTAGYDIGFGRVVWALSSLALTTALLALVLESPRMALALAILGWALTPAAWFIGFNRKDLARILSDIDKERSDDAVSVEIRVADLKSRIVHAEGRADELRKYIAKSKCELKAARMQADAPVPEAPGDSLFD